MGREIKIFDVLFLAQAMYTGNALLLSTEQLKYLIERQ